MVSPPRPCGRLMSLRRVSAIVTVVGTVSFVVTTAAFGVWEPLPDGALSFSGPSRYFTTDEIARGEDFGRWARVWGLSSLTVSLIVGGVLGFTRLGAALVERLPGPWWAQVPLAAVTIELIGRIITLPFAVAARQHERNYGLSDQPWGEYVIDLIKSEAVSVLVTSVALLMAIYAARRWRRAWPAIAGGGLASLVVVGSLLYPVVIEPLFNSFSSLPDGDLRAQVLELADRENLNVDDVLVADASRRTTRLNAYVSGFGSTRRVVVYDNLVNDLGQQETLGVVAHEMAHARHQDVLAGTLLGAAGAITGIGILGLVMSRRADEDGLANPRTIPFLLTVLMLATVLVAPVENGISRRIGTRADAESLRLTGNTAAFIALHQELARRSAADLTPPSWSQFWFGSHPTTLSRMALAESTRDVPSRRE